MVKPNNVIDNNKLIVSLLRKPIVITNQIWHEDTKPLVSIVCNTFNHERFIANAIEGFLIQKTTFKVEILIRDDASTDGTAEIVRAYADKYPQLIKATCQIENQYRKKPKTSKYIQPPAPVGKYLAKCEGDDYWIYPLKLQTQVEFLESHPEYTLSSGGFQTMDESGRIISTTLKKMPGMDEEGFTFTLKEMTGQWLTKTLTNVYRRDIPVLKSIGEYKYHRDIHTAYHLIKNGKGYYHYIVFGIYRVHQGGIFSAVSKIDNAAYHLNLYAELHEHNQDEFTRKMYLKAILIYLFHSFMYSPEDQSIAARSKLLGRFISLMKFPSDIPFVFIGFLRLTGLKKK
jgi:glycosyltransferase involved in cell wall biosynthesis